MFSLKEKHPWSLKYNNTHLRNLRVRALMHWCREKYQADVSWLNLIWTTKLHKWHNTTKVWSGLSIHFPLRAYENTFAKLSISFTLLPISGMQVIQNEWCGPYSGLLPISALQRGLSINFTTIRKSFQRFNNPVPCSSKRALNFFSALFIYQDTAAT